MLKRLFKITVWIGQWVVLAGLLSSCVTGGEVRLRQNLGDMIIPRLQIGMTHSEVDAAIVDLRKYVISDDRMTIQSESLLFGFFSDDYYPKDVLKTVEVGTAYRVLGYRTSGSGAGSICLFFDDRTQRLRGWANTPSSLSRDKFMHEWLTSQLIWSDSGARKGMSRAQVYALIGRPVEIVDLLQKSRNLYEDHFWVQSPWKGVEVYGYRLSNETTRRVYLIYYPKADELLGWGYDHAWEEAERYLREKAQKK